MQPLWRTLWKFLKKLNMKLPYEPAIPPLGIYPKDENSNLKRDMYLNVHCSAVYNSQDMETTQVPISRWMNKENVLYMCVCIYIYTHTYIYTCGMEYYPLIKKWNIAICSNTDIPEKDKNYIIYLWNL